MSITVPKHYIFARTIDLEISRGLGIGTDHAETAYTNPEQELGRLCAQPSSLYPKIYWTDGLLQGLTEFLQADDPRVQQWCLDMIAQDQFASLREALAASCRLVQDDSYGRFALMDPASIVQVDELSICAAWWIREEIRITGLTTCVCTGEIVKELTYGRVVHIFLPRSAYDNGVRGVAKAARLIWNGAI